MATSKCNPFKLSAYSSSGREMCATLETKAADLTSALDALRASSSEYLPSLGGSDATMTDLAGDWFHLDEFAGDVANGFFQANPHLLDHPMPGAMENMVLTVDDLRLATLGEVGYASRDQAILEANELAGQLNKIMEDGGSDEEVAALLAGANRGQYDPAFAVTFVEAVGVEGLTNIVHLVEGEADPDHLREQPAWGLALLAPFSTTLTTALDTRAGIEDIDRRDLANADLPDSQRISEEFVQSLTTDWRGDSDQEFRLSLLMSQADPPTDVAVAIANNRMSPYMPGNSAFEPDGAPIVWSTSSGVLTNYAEMLGRNDDASAQWLDYEFPSGTSNLDLVLETQGEYFVDDGQAIARVVENGVTHWDTELRESLMDEAIDTVGGDMDEIRNFFMEDALVSGVERNMDLIAERVTEVGGGTVGASEGQADQILNTHDFVRELMQSQDPAIGARVYSATLEFVHDQLHQAGPGEPLGAETTQIGAVTALVTEADINAEVGDAKEQAARREAFLGAFNKVVDSAVGLIPGGGTAVSLGKDALGWGVDAILDEFKDTESVNEALANGTDYRAATQNVISLALANHEYATGGMSSADAIAAAEDHGATGDVDFFVDGTSGEKRPIKPIAEMSEEEYESYLHWVSSDEMSDLITQERTYAGQAADNIQELVEGRT